MTVIPTIDHVDALAAEYADKSPREILELALSQEGEIAISFSGAEDVVLIDIASRIGKPFRVFSLDTGRLHAETYQFIETVRKHYNINIEICFPESAAVQQLVNEKAGGSTRVLSTTIKNNPYQDTVLQHHLMATGAHGALSSAMGYGIPAAAAAAAIPSQSKFLSQILKYIFALS